MTRFVLAIALAIFTPPVFADDIDRLIGTWLSSDGKTKQQFERSFGGEWIDNRLWFKTPQGWKLVSQGAMYRKPGDDNWHGVARATDMEGIVLFEFEIEAVSDSVYVARNIAYFESGETFPSEEEWRFESDDEWSYTVFFENGGERQPRIEGTWLRSE
jgi:hypothetical protein